jgi:hypothetical protein
MESCPRGQMSQPYTTEVLASSRLPFGRTAGARGFGLRRVREEGMEPAPTWGLDPVLRPPDSLPGLGMWPPGIPGEAMQYIFNLQQEHLMVLREQCFAPFTRLPRSLGSHCSPSP